jgi:hypothetical protein
LPVARKLVTEGELLGILTERMNRLPHGKGAAVLGVIALRQPDITGCNWMPDFDATNSSLALMDVFAKARFEFLLKEDVRAEQDSRVRNPSPESRTKPNPPEG